MINLEIPLNQGCLAPCIIKIPKGTILNPAGAGAICGSTIAAQRITDVILKAFGTCSTSQGWANSFGFGTGGKDAVTGQKVKGLTYREALGGGVGAGPNWHGAHATNVHATNNRSTDVEVIDRVRR
jgi:5-oxoprolinase (ATP-hydrolysing)